jgi:hypothetical protein
MFIIKGNVNIPQNVHPGKSKQLLLLLTSKKLWTLRGILKLHREELSLKSGYNNADHELP